jgi:hypothetical protein
MLHRDEVARRIKSKEHTQFLSYIFALPISSQGGSNDDRINYPSRTIPRPRLPSSEELQLQPDEEKTVICSA